MKRKIWIGITVFVLIALIGVIGVIGIERNKTKKALQERQVSAPEAKDTIPPIIILKGNKEITIKHGEIYKEPGYSATDDIDGSIVGKVTTSKQMVNEKQYKLIYEVKDKAGNVGRAERIINLEQPIIINQSNNNKQTSNQLNTKTQTNLNEKGVIYLTFDDGPTNSSTPKILDILKKHNVKATFFILNYNSNTEALVKREVAEGHSVGIHGYSHDYKKIYTSEVAYMENLNKLQAKIYKSTGVKTTITRFPGGSSNTISKFNPGIMTKLSKLVVQNGYTYYDWNVDSNDAGGAKNADVVYYNVTKNLSKKWRNIVLMHDFSGNKKTINALERIIEYGKKNGYTFKTITPTTKMMRHTINN